MQFIFRSLFSLVATMLPFSAGTVAAQPSPVTPAAPPAIELIDFKVGSDYYPMLEEKSAVIGADSSDFPRTEGEKLARRNGRRNALDRAEEVREQGKLRTRIQMLSDASWVQATMRNVGGKPIQAIEWDFAFPRREEGQVRLRYAVVSKVIIKPGSKKTLKQQLPAGASKCKVISVGMEAAGNERGRIFDSVCGAGIQDASQLKQETVTIRRIEYADGTVWQKQ